MNTNEDDFEIFILSTFYNTGLDTGTMANSVCYDAVMGWGMILIRKKFVVKSCSLLFSPFLKWN